VRVVLDLLARFYRSTKRSLTNNAESPTTPVGPDVIAEESGSPLIERVSVRRSKIVSEVSIIPPC
jgi:hypothetical protein